VGVALVIAAVAVLGIGVFVGKKVVGDGDSVVSKRPADEPTGEFRDEKAGFGLTFPKTWTRYSPPDPDISLVVSEKPAEENSGGSILVRVIPIGTAITAERLEEARQLTDQLVLGEGVEVKAEPTQVTRAGLPGYYYLYTFDDKASGQRGAHSHYFLFKDQNMITIVFQALPETDFARLAKTFDAVESSFRAL